MRHLIKQVGVFFHSDHFSSVEITQVSTRVNLSSPSRELQVTRCQSVVLKPFLTFQT